MRREFPTAGVRDRYSLIYKQIGLLPGFSKEKSAFEEMRFFFKGCF